LNTQDLPGSSIGGLVEPGRLATGVGILRALAKVIVVGSTNTDMTVRVPRIPAPGETAGGRDFRVSGGGKGANQAVAAARAGATVEFLTAVGDDVLGEQALASLHAEGIELGLAQRVPGPSGVALIVVDDTGENAIAVAAGANGELRPAHVQPIVDRVGPGDVLLLQLEIPMDAVLTAATLASARAARVVLNPAPAPPDGLPDALLRAVTVLTPNEHEAGHITGVRVDDAGGLARAAAVLHGRGVPHVLITLGGRGVFISSEGGARLVPALPAAAIDTTAAGDVFCGALAVALTEGRSVEDAARFAVAAAAISVTRAGAQASAPSRAEIDALLQSTIPSP
jgi:ribokinase